MSWEPLGVKRPAAEAPVTIATSVGAGRPPPFLYINLRLQRLPTLPFLAMGGLCDVMFGRENDAGRLRVVAGARSTIAAAGRFGSASGAAIIRVRLPDGIKPAKREPQAVEFRHAEDWLELTLPAWAVAVERVTAPVPVGRISIMDRVPDPDASRRGVR